MTILPLILILLLQSDPADATADDPPVEPTADGAAADELFPLSLDDAISFALLNNLGLRGSQLDTEAFMEGFRASWGDFDTVFYAQATRSESIDAPSPVAFAGAINLGGAPATEFDIFNVSTGFRGAWQTGTQWSLDLTYNNLRAATDGTGAMPGTRSDVHTGEFGVSLTQPLLRGGADDFVMSTVKLAAQDVRITSLSAETVANDLLQSVITAYWNLVFTIQDVATGELSVELAQELLDITQRKFDQGLQNRIDVVEAEAEVARREEELLTARNALEQAKDDLRTLVLTPEATEAWNRDFQPTTDYAEIEAGDMVDVEAAIAVALRHRPDLRTSRLELERADLELDRASNQSLPKLDLTGGYGLNSNRSNAGRAIGRLDDSNFREARLFLDFELPLGNRSAEHTERRRRLERERAAVSLRESELNAIAAVRQAARDVQLQTQRVVATAETTRLRQEVYDGETRRLENDLSTPFQVREAQRDLLEAIDSETRARLDLAVSRTALLAAQGLLLPTYGYEPSSPDVSLEEAPPAP